MSHNKQPPAEPAKVCFVISPIGDEGTDARKRSDQVLEHIIKPAVAAIGFEVLRADRLSEPGMITSQIIQHVIEDALVVADLTDRNPNVFYELALRHAAKKPLVQIVKKGEKIPFDVAGMRTIFVDHTDLDSVAEAKAEITKQASSLFAKGAEIQTPVSAALEIQSLRKSERPEDRSLATILAELAFLRQTMAQMDQNGRMAAERNQSVLIAIEKMLTAERTRPGLTGLSAWLHGRNDLSEAERAEVNRYLQSAFNSAPLESRQRRASEELTARSETSSDVARAQARLDADDAHIGAARERLQLDLDSQKKAAARVREINPPRQP